MSPQQRKYRWRDASRISTNGRQLARPDLRQAVMLPIDEHMQEVHKTLLPGVLHIGGVRRRVVDMVDASAEYRRLRDASELGASEFPEGVLLLNNTRYRISYNGNVWPDQDWREDTAPLYVPRS